MIQLRLYLDKTSGAVKASSSSKNEK